MALAYRDPSGDVVKKFLADNKVRSGWKNLISGDDDVKYYLRQIILKLGLLKGEIGPMPQNLTKYYAHSLSANLKMSKLSSLARRP